MQRLPLQLFTPTPYRHQMWIVASIALVLVVVLGFSLAYYPLLLLPIIGAAGMVALSTLQERIQSVCVASLVVLVLGYLFLGKGFSYIGVPPIYIGEIMLLLGVAALLFGRVRLQLIPLEVLFFFFMILGLIHTIPYVMPSGLDAIRDAALWYYAFFAILVSQLLNERRLARIIDWFTKILPVLLIWFTIMPLTKPLISFIPRFPGAPVPIISVTKPGDRAVILVALAAFVIVGLYSRPRGRRRMSPTVFWSLWLASAMVVASTNRGGMLAMWFGATLLILLKPSREWFRPLIVGATAITIVLLWNPTIDTGGTRPLSAQQFMTNVTSIFSNESADVGSVQGTKEWRLQWWTEIYDDTVRGEDFFTGKGFGINLATAYGYQTHEGDALRSPHSVHVTILARMGVPGLALWIILNFTFGIQIVRASFAAWKQGDTKLSSIYLWIIPIWAAALVNASFDVYLEGPQGAIPFWCLLGVGLGTLRLQRMKYAAPDYYPMV